MKFMNKLIFMILLFLLLFVIACLAVIIITGIEPTTLIITVFSFCGFECGIMGWIKTTKISKKDEENNE